MPFAEVSTDYENISARTEGTAFTDEEPEQLGLVGQHPDGVAEALPRGELRFRQL